MKNKWLYWCGLITLIFLCLPATAWAADNPVEVNYRGHIQDLGDYPRDGSWVDSPEMIGTVGHSKRIEGFEIKLTGTVPEGMELRYNVHVQNKGWLYDEDDSANWPKDGAYAGTRGDSLRIEAVKIVLTDSAGKAVTGYSVQYRGHVQNVGDLPADKTQWLANGAQLGTVGSSLRLEALLVQVVKTGTDPVEPPAPVSVVYDKAGTFGPATGNETITGDATIAADGVILQNLEIQGNLTISEAVGDGNVTLNNVTVKGYTFVRGGGIHSIKINGGKYSRIVLEKTASGAVRIVALNVDGIPFVVSEAAAGETIILEGAFESVTVNAPNMTVTTQGATTTIGKMTVSAEAAGSTVTVATGTTVTDLVLDGKATIKGQGNVAKAEVKADGVVFEKKPGAVTVEPGVVIPPVFPTPDSGGGSGGGYTPPTPIAVTAVSLNKTALNLSFNDKETLAATVAPADAANKAVSWTTSDATIATVDATGKVTGSANKEGTATITVTTQDSNKTAACLVTVKNLNLAITGLTVPFHGDKPDATIADTAQYSGAVTWREQGASADLQDMDHFDGAKTYVATITLSLIAPYTVADIDANCFKVAGATTANGANTAVVTAVFAPVNQYRIDITGVITAYSGSGGELVIPDRVIHPPNGTAIVRGIGYQAFYSRGLTGVTLPQTVKTIGTAAFGENDLTELVIPDGVTDISQSAFFGNDNLTTVTLPGGIQVGDHAFEDDLITSITIGNNETISNVADTMGVHGSAFYAYYVNAVAGKPAKTAGHYVYNSVSDSWQIDNGLSFSGATITAYDKTRGPYVFIPKTGAGTDITAIADGDESNLTGVFSDSSLKTLTFASDSQLTTIGSLAFAQNQLASISLPDTVETIGYCAFYVNPQLKNVTLTSGLKTIDNSAFQNCSLETLTLPNGLETIGVAAFAFNKLAGTLTIPASVTNINVGAFRENAITSLVFEETAGTPSTLKIQGCAFNADDASNNPITRITIPAGVMISDDATTMGYYGANFKAAYTAGGAGIYNYDSGTATWIKEAIAVGVTAPFNGIAPNTAISADAQGRFTGAVSWTETVTPGAAFTKFDGAKAYTATITLTPTSLYTFPAGTTFSVAGADSVATTIGTNGLTATVTANYAVKDRYEIDSGGVITAYSGPGGELVVPGTIDGKTVIGIDKSVFFTNMSLTNVTLPDTIQSLSEKSFESCVNLQAINIPKYIRSIPASCFSGCSKLKTVTIPPEASLQTIDGGAFYSTNLKTMVIPATVTAIEKSAFEECRQLEAVTFTANSQLKTIGDNAFNFCALTELNLPATVTAIGENAFIANKLTKLTLNNPNGSALTIGRDAFSGSPQIPSQNPITEITLPAGVSLPIDTQANVATMGLYGAAFKSFYESTAAGGNNSAGGTFVYDVTNGGWSIAP